MKATDVIAQLSALPPDTEIMCCYCSWCEGEDSKGVEVVQSDYHTRKDGKAVYVISGTFEGTMR